MARWWAGLARQWVVLAGRGLCASCGGRRMAQTAARLVDHVLPVVPIRQWVLSLPYSLPTMLGYDPELLGVVLRVFMRAVSGWIRDKVREKVGLIDGRDVHFGAVTFIQATRQVVQPVVPRPHSAGANTSEATGVAPLAPRSNAENPLR